LMQNSLKMSYRRNNSEADSIFLITGNEFRRIIRHPLVLVISCILFGLTIINAMGNSIMMLSNPEVAELGQNIFIQYGVEPVFSVTLELCSLVALFIGAMSLAEEMTGKSFGVLIIKPLYRRDVIAGKFIGLNLFVLLLVAANFILCSVLLAALYGTTSMAMGSILRLSVYIFVVFLMCSITMTIAMLFGIVLKDMLKAAVVAMTYYIADSHGSLNGYLGSLGLYMPQNLFSAMTSASGLLYTTTPLAEWLSAALPYIFLIILEILVVLVTGLLIFSRSNE
jgi:ABC-2 type transport system permease protein